MFFPKFLPRKYSIYNIYNMCLRNDAQSMFRETGKNQGKSNNSCHFLINIFFLIFYVNIQPCCSKKQEWIFQQKNQTDN